LNIYLDKKNEIPNLVALDGYDEGFKAVNKWLAESEVMKRRGKALIKRKKKSTPKRRE